MPDFDSTRSKHVSERCRTGSTKNLVIGLDGADVELMLSLGSDRLPTLTRLMKTGAWSRQQSVQPPATLPNWTTFLTGVDPGQHGVFDFTTREGYRVHFTAGSVREAPTLMARLDKMGRRCACIGFPATYPPERLDHGVFISGWDAPVAFDDDPSFVWPRALHGKIKERFGATRFDDVDEFDADTDGWHDELSESLVKRIERKAELGAWLLGGEDWDLFALYFGESDTASHHLWAHHDTSSPRHVPGASSPAARAGLGEVYEALDAAVARLLDVAGENVEVTIVSDHGSGGSGDRVLYLNRALADAGLLTFRSSSFAERLRSRVTQRVKDAALTLLPPVVRQGLFRFAGAMLPSLLESFARFGAIDMERTRAFSDELNYFPGVWLNQRHREPSGVVEESERDSTLRAVERALRALRDPYSGQPVVEHVWRREELFEGPFLERAPDLLLGLHLVDGYSYNLMPSASAPASCEGAWRRLQRDEFHGRKGRSLGGSHRDKGLFIAHGPRVAAVGEIESAIADASATLLARMDVSVPANAAGRVLYEVLTDASGECEMLPRANVQKRTNDGAGEAAVERRLRALGYID